MYLRTECGRGIWGGQSLQERVFPSVTGEPLQSRASSQVLLVLWLGVEWGSKAASDFFAGGILLRARCLWDQGSL